MTCGAPIPETVTLHVPFRVVMRGGRKQIQLPDDAAPSHRTDNTLLKARAFRWKRMLESGEFTTIAEVAEREGIAPSYMIRVLRLTVTCAGDCRGHPGWEAGAGGQVGAGAQAVSSRVGEAAGTIQMNVARGPFRTFETSICAG